MNKIGAAVDKVMESKPMQKFAGAMDGVVEFLNPSDGKDYVANWILAASAIPLAASGLVLYAMTQNPEIWNAARVLNTFNLSQSVFGATLMAKMWNKSKGI